MDRKRKRTADDDGVREPRGPTGQGQEDVSGVSPQPQSPLVKIVTDAASVGGTPKASMVKTASESTPKQSKRLSERSLGFLTPVTDGNLNIIEKTRKTPASARRTPTGRGKVELLWCWHCDGRASASCVRSGHERAALQAARSRTAEELRAAQGRLRRLEELEVQGATVRLRCTVEVAGFGKQDMELALSGIGEADLRALCLYLEGLELEPEEEHLSASSAGCEAIAPKCARLPDRLEGVTLRPGAVLLLGTLDRGGEEGEDEEGGASDSEEEDCANRSWYESPPALRIYYDRPVRPKQARGSKILGYITSNLKHLAAARPSTVSDVAPDEGRTVRFSSIVVISSQ